jgi:hypothetical protein
MMDSMTEDQKVRRDCEGPSLKIDRAIVAPDNGCKVLSSCADGRANARLTPEFAKSRMAGLLKGHVAWEA